MYENLKPGQGYVWEPGPSSSKPGEAQTVRGLKLELSKYYKRTAKRVVVERIGQAWVVTRIR